MFGNVSKYISSHIFSEFPFELWKILDKAFGLQEIEDEAWSEPNISSCSLSQYFLAFTFSDEEVSHTVHVAAVLFDSNASSFNQEANIEEPYFSVSLEVENIDSSSYDVVDEKEVTNGYGIAIDYSLTHSVFSISSIMDYEIHMPDLSHFVHASLLDGVQPNDF